MSTVSKLTNGVLGTTKQIYLAGLGVVATVTDQSSKTFNSLVEKGEQSTSKKSEGEKKANLLLENPVSQNVKRVADKASDRVQEGVSTVLGRLGVPTRNDILAFSDSIDKLTERVNAMQKENVA